MIPAHRRQIEASEPLKNTWLSANAGSGKTRVLTDRVARLLLNGVEPQRILCLTYTKAAASEMQNRLFKTLGAWAMKPDGELRTALQQLGEEEGLSDLRLAEARRLFARAIEAPGGLRIQTIHSFSAALLRRFPLEAGVSPAFTELDDRAAKLVRAEIVEEMAETLAPDLIARLSRVYTSEYFGNLIEQVARERGHLRQQGLTEAESRALFGVRGDLDDAGLISATFLGDEAGWMPALITALQAGSVRDQAAFKALRFLNFSSPTLSDLAALEDLFLTGAKTKEPFTAKIGALPTKATRALVPDLMPPLEALMTRVEAARHLRIALQAARKSAALHAFAAVFLPLYDAHKATRGLLDFDDLIAKASALLTDPSLAPWVLYRLDGGIDHILVDEAQDTSPDQWRIIESLTGEATAGEGAQTRSRSLFVVGDKKQSIYSFQGADVAVFDAKKRYFGEKLAAVGNGLAELTLGHSFRSSTAILRLVDYTFPPHQLAALGGEISHFPVHEALPGRVDIWPPFEKLKKPEPGNWYDPVDQPAPEDPVVQLARRISAEIRRMIETGVQIPLRATGDAVEARPVHAGDFLVLVQRRSLLFQEIIRACKQENLPIAGADRLKLGAELAVKDLAALLSFLDTPEDDLSLAAVLRSPLCNWSEDQLFRLSHGRKGYLWEALREHADHAETRGFLQDMRDQADFLRPYDLIERVLNRHDGRRKLLARLGPEAEDGIDELLSQALSYERADVPSLTRFLVWLETDDVEVKRQLDGEGHRIRVMTVHGAKGLEAPIVILPDTADRQPRERDELYRLPDGMVVWKTAADESPPLIQAEREARNQRRQQESLRLLYVAMTRARCWLIVAAAGELKQESAWYTMIRKGAATLGVLPAEGGILRHGFGDWPGDRPEQPAASVTPDIPRWALAPAPEPERAAAILSPSDLGGAKALQGEPILADTEMAKAWGTGLHLLLERLPASPAEAWSSAAKVLIPNDDFRDALLAEASMVLREPALAPLFATGSLAEVAVTGDWNGRRMAGTVDRLIIGPDRILVVDYKSNAVVPARQEEIPEGVLRQLGAYAHLLAGIYPDRRIEAAVLWTRVPRLMSVDPDIVRSALARTTIP
ncbi:MAG: double-strand break repair helicase AddA [Tabrizicola sp.]|nr:double-strand break repair helicase AddA [Tabrizicola sp.]